MNRGTVLRLHSLLLLVTAAKFILLPDCLFPQNIENLKNGVVKVTAVVTGKRKVGTGFVVKLDGSTAYIITASHVVEGDPQPKVAFHPQPSYDFTAKTVSLEGGRSKRTRSSVS